MPLCLAVSVFALVSLFALPALAEESVVEGKIAWLEFSTKTGISFELEGRPVLCQHGHKNLRRPVHVAGLRGGFGGGTSVPPELLAGLLEAKRSGHKVRIRTEPRTYPDKPYCGLIAITLL
ncbi:MAG TPA: hypothetical protein VK013_05545 [Myxococcaceae bacterium]|nr:hypothetical protein [Myxococcaceae bacterium]